MTDAALRELADRAGVSETLMERALEWQVRLWSGECGSECRARLEQWRDEHTDHDRAWQHVQQLTGRLDAVPPTAAAKGLREVEQTEGRRRALKTLALVLVAGGSGYMAWQTPLVRGQFADLRTATGQIREFELPDGTRLVLNTASAVNVDFSPAQRRIALVTGEMLVETGRDQKAAPGGPRPFVAETFHGNVQPVGTRFVVRQRDAGTEVTVIEGAVQIRPNAATASSAPIAAGHRVRFNARSIQPLPPVPDSAGWVDGRIVVEQATLGALVDTLDRYHPGFLRCDPQAAELRVTGTFPIDTERALTALERALPIRVERRTRFWVTIRAR